MSATVGVVFGIMAWAGLALLGLHIILEHAVWVQTLIKIAGGGYLIYLGVGMLKASLTNARKSDEPESFQPISDKVAFRSGLLTNLANPKAAIYFGSIFATFLTQTTSTTDKIAMFSLISVESLLWFVLVGLLFSLPIMRRLYAYEQKWVDRIAGTIFATFGLRLILTSRS